MEGHSGDTASSSAVQASVSESASSASTVRPSDLCTTDAADGTAVAASTAHRVTSGGNVLPPYGPTARSGASEHDAFFFPTPEEGQAGRQMYTKWMAKQNEAKLAMSKKSKKGGRADCHRKTRVVDSSGNELPSPSTSWPNTPVRVNTSSELTGNKSTFPPNSGGQEQELRTKISQLELQVEETSLQLQERDEHIREQNDQIASTQASMQDQIDNMRQLFMNAMQASQVSQPNYHAPHNEFGYSRFQMGPPASMLQHPTGANYATQYGFDDQPHLPTFQREANLSPPEMVGFATSDTPQPAGFGMGPNPADDVFGNGHTTPMSAVGLHTPSPQESPRKTLREAISAVFVNAEAAVRRFQLLPITKIKSSAARRLIELCQNFLVNRREAFGLLEDPNTRHLLITGVVNHEIVDKILKTGLMSEFQGGESRNFAEAWNEEFFAPTVERGLRNHEAKLELARRRSAYAVTIANAPGFWVWIQQNIIPTVTDRIANTVAPAVPRDAFPAFRMQLKKAVNDAVKLAIRLRADATRTYFQFPRLGTSWNAETMVSRNLELRNVMAQASNTDLPYHARCVVAPLVTQRYFEAAVEDPEILHKAEVLLVDRAYEVHPIMADLNLPPWHACAHPITIPETPQRARRQYQAPREEPAGPTYARPHRRGVEYASMAELY